MGRGEVWVELDELIEVVYSMLELGRIQFSDTPVLIDYPDVPVELVALSYSVIALSNLPNSS